MRFLKLIEVRRGRGGIPACLAQLKLWRSSIILRYAQNVSAARQNQALNFSEAASVHQKPRRGRRHDNSYSGCGGKEARAAATACSIFSCSDSARAKTSRRCLNKGVFASESVCLKASSRARNCCNSSESGRRDIWSRNWFIFSAPSNIAKNIFVLATCISLTSRANCANET